MEELPRIVAEVVSSLLAIAALIVSIRASQRAKREREFEVLLEENRRETANCKEAIDREARERQERIDRRDRKFEALPDRNDALTRQLAGVVARVGRNETRLEAMEAVRHRTAADPAAPAPGETEAVAAQAVPVERRPE